MERLIKTIEVPTGHICIMQGEYGLLEFVSLGDYGKEQNLKADFLGLTNEINGVQHGKLLPLEEKWVITISTRTGCQINCTFCDCPKLGPGKNATACDMFNQVMYGIDLHPEVKKTKRLNVHFARCGEPTFNGNSVLEANNVLYTTIKANRGWGYHPVISTMFPNKNNNLHSFIQKWMQFKNSVNGEAGLQISVNTTDEEQRQIMFGGNAAPLAKISATMKAILEEEGLQGRKIALNFALTNNEIDAEILMKYFDPQYFLCKLTPMHITTACKTNKLSTKEGYSKYYSYRKVENALKEKGFDVIVFIPSKEEDESRITCGNAILADGIDNG